MYKLKEMRQGKLDSKAQEGISFGYDRGKAYQVFIPKQEKAVGSQDVKLCDKMEPTST